MKVVTAAQMAEVDRITIEERGVPAVLLMGLAGRAVADYVLGRMPGMRRIAVFSGTGNNGGDGFAAAYYLTNSGRRAEVFLAGSQSRISETATIYRDICAKSGVSVIQVEEPTDAAGLDLAGYDLIVDAMLGTGFSGEARGTVADLIRVINDSDLPVLSVDVPSGLGSDGEAPRGEAVIADVTVTIGLPKISLVTYPGAQYAGVLHVADIGFPASLTRSSQLTIDLADEDFFRDNGIYEIEAEFATAADTHKAEKGHLLLVGGFDGMEGAIMMSAMAALETGVGLVSLVCSASSRDMIAGRIPELITIPLPGASGEGESTVALLEKSLIGIFSARRYGALVIGPGMGRTPFSRAVFHAIMDHIHDYGVQRALIDGDGLFHLAEYLKTRTLDAATEFIVTPHFMEASRISGIPLDLIRSNRLRSAGELGRGVSCTVLLKGPASIVSDGERFTVNTTGSAALATAGSGDVLSGIIGSLLLRKLTCMHAAAFGAFVHGKASDLHRAATGSDVMKATDILRYIREAKKPTGAA
jgi:hydroxyethylthiazole kinase-like uncharacterized protein yjeF